MKKNKPTRISIVSTRFVPTAEDWHGTFCFDAHGKEIERYTGKWIGLNREENEEWKTGSMMARICVQISGDSDWPNWSVMIHITGNDDEAICRRYVMEQKDAMEQYHRWVTWMNNLVVAQREQLLKLGFYYD